MEKQIFMLGSREPELQPIMRITNEEEAEEQTASSAFIEANTIPIGLKEIQEKHIIPVYVRDNEPLISQGDFVQTTYEAVTDLFKGVKILKPQIRVSHPIKGRIPEAKDKPANQLQEWERTLYYERMMFVIEIPSVMDVIDGNQLSLTVGGVKAYNLDNLYTKKGGVEHFKLFIGFQNKVCTNMCIKTDGYLSDLRVSTLDKLRDEAYHLLGSYDQHRHLKQMQSLTNYSLSEQQFAQLIGRCRMYQYLPSTNKKEIPGLLFGDSQLSMVCKDYYRDNSFCRQEDGAINLWKLYNLFTGANKSTYIDQFLDRSVNALEFITQVQGALNGSYQSWFLS